MKNTPFMLCIWLSLLLCGCVYDYRDPLVCGDNTVARLMVGYDREWEYPEPGGRDWKREWPALGFDFPYDSLLPKVPDGLRSILYDEDDLEDIRNISASGGHVYIFGEDPALLLFNNDTEYDVLDDIHDLDGASVTTRRVERTGYDGSPYAKDATVLIEQPDVMFRSFIFPIEYSLSTDTLTLKTTMTPMVYDYVVRFGVKEGMEYIAIARGALSGMNCGTKLRSGDAFGSRVSIAFDATPKEGYILAIVRSFGHKWQTFQTYGLNLEVRLKNGNILDFDFDITDQISQQPRGGVIMVDGVEIPEDIAKEDTGVFDVDVEGWGEFEDIPLEF